MLVSPCDGVTRRAVSLPRRMEHAGRGGDPQVRRRVLRAAAEEGVDAHDHDALQRRGRHDHPLAQPGAGGCRDEGGPR